MDWGELQAKFNFWYVRKFVRLDKQYTFMHDMAKENAIAVRLIGKYDGVIVEFENVRLGAANQMLFDTTLIANPNLKNVESKAFLRFTANVMRSIIISSIENIEKVDNETRNFDLVEPADERELHEEGSSIFEEPVPDRKPRKKAIRRNKAVHPKV